VALLEPLHLAMAVAGVMAGTLVLLRPVLAIPMLLFAVPFGSLAEVEAGNLSISATEPLVALLAVAWLARGVAEHRISLRGGPLVFAICALIALMVFSITYALAPAPAVKESLKWLELLVVLVVVLDLVRDRVTTSRLLLALFAAGSAEAVWGAVQSVTGSGPSGFAVAGALRAYGHFEQPNPFAGYLTTILPVSLALSLARSGRGFRWLAVGATLALALGVAASQSRGAWLGLAAAMVVLLTAWSRRSRGLLFPAFGAALFAVLLAMAGLLPATLTDRLSQALAYFGVFDVRTVQVTSENWAVVERMAHWQAGWYMFLDHPWLGVGAGNYPEAYPRYYLADWLEPLGHAHNYYLNMLAELGVAGFALWGVFLSLAFAALMAGLRETRQQTADAHAFWRPLLIGVLAAMVVFCTHNLFDNLLVHGMSVQVGFLLGVGLVAARQLRGDELELGQEHVH
jgi:putative inorganic carbon (HCO3(-)) transporter